MIAIYYCTILPAFRANCLSTCHQLEHIFRRRGCQLKTSNHLMGQVVSYFKKSGIYPFPFQIPHCFLMCSLCTQLSCWTTLQRSLAVFPELLHSRQWSGISYSSMAIQLGWFRYLLLICTSNGGTDYFFLNSLPSKDSPRAPAAASTLEPLPEPSYALSHCSILCLVNSVRCELPAQWDRKPSMQSKK